MVSLVAEGECKPLAQAKASFSAPGATAREIIMSGVIRLGPEAQLWRRRSKSLGGKEAGRDIREALCSAYGNHALPPKALTHLLDSF